MFKMFKTHKTVKREKKEKKGYFKQMYKRRDIFKIIKQAKNNRETQKPKKKTVSPGTP